MTGKLDLKDKILHIYDNKDYLLHIEVLDNLEETWFIFQNHDYQLKKIEDSWVLFKFDMHMDENESIFTDIDEQIKLEIE